MTHINYNLKVRRKNMRCTKTKYDITKAFVDSFKETIEDNKKMKDALLAFSQYLQGKFNHNILLDCHDDELNKLMNSVYKGIRELKEKYNENTKQD